MKRRNVLVGATVLGSLRLDIAKANRVDGRVLYGPPSACTIRRIISGGQTGVDRAALDAAIALGLPIGGWVPKGRRAEDGPIPERYQSLRETDTDLYETRTRWNVRDSSSDGEIYEAAREVLTRVLRRRR